MKLWAHQERGISELREAFRTSKHVLGVAPTGCHRAGQGILMYDGTIRSVETIVIGDQIMGPDSRPRTVIDLCRGHQQMARVTPVKGDSFVVNLDHVLTLVRLNDGSKHAGAIVDVTVREWLTWNRTNKWVHKLFRVPIEFTARNELPLEPYFLGMLIADGTMSQNATGVSKPDPEIRAECERQAALHGLKLRVYDQNGTKCPTMYFSAGLTGGALRNPITQKLRAVGLHGHTGDTKFVPQAYKTASRTDRLALLAGLLDGDGHLSNGGFDFISKSERLARDVVFVARSVGLAAYVRACEKYCQTGGGGTYWRVSISGDCNIIPTILPRKKASPRRQIKSVLRTAFAVDLLDEEPFFGFTLDGDGRYLLDDFTVTHNSGKTVLGGWMVREVVARGYRVLWIAHTKELVAQPFEQFTALGLAPGIIQAGVAPSQSPVQVATIQTLTRREMPPAEFVVFDETHLHVGTASSQRVIEHYPTAWILGLTASPWRLDGRSFAPQFEKLVTIATPMELIRAGILVQPKYFAPSMPDLTNVKTTDGDYEKAGLELACDRPDIIGDVVQTYLARARGRQAVLFAVSRKHSHDCCEAFLAAGVRAAHLDGETPPRERERIVQEFRAGLIDIVCNVEVLTTGFDHKELSCVIIARPTKSIALWMQMVGRAMRVADGKTDALVLDHAGNTMRLGFAHADREWSLVRQAKTKTKSMSLMTCERCFAVFTPRVRCTECGHEHAAESGTYKVAQGSLFEVKVAFTPEQKAKAFAELCGDAVRMNLSRDYVKRQFHRRFGHWPRGMKWPATLPIDIELERAKLERIAQAKGLGKWWVENRLRELR